jgi:hypothetical protein
VIVPWLSVAGGLRDEDKPDRFVVAPLDVFRKTRRRNGSATVGTNLSPRDGWYRKPDSDRARAVAAGRQRDLSVARPAPLRNRGDNPAGACLSIDMA